ncbi:MAG TPA: LLM class F420-dependent oxidoreductase [Chloroflexota bacterium]|jgi:probable F420-dependent oxidoreductase
MHTGAVLGQNEVGDAGAIRAYAQAVQELGYDFLVTADHVVGADPAAYPELERVYPIASVLHEPLTLYAFIAGVAPRLGLLSSVVILPQRQTVLAAKQAAEIDLLTGGKFRFGVGIGWNPIEFQALNENFKNRARRFEEQVEVMRRLWTEPVVTFEGRYHSLRAAGINPRPVQRPVPIWIGAAAEPAVRRACAIGDGYLPLRPLDGGWEATIEKVDGWLREAGRDRRSFGLEGRLDAGAGGPDEWGGTVEMWRRFGASHLSVGAGGGSVDAQIERLRQARAVLTG